MSRPFLSPSLALVVTDPLATGFILRFGDSVGYRKLATRLVGIALQIRPNVGRQGFGSVTISSRFAGRAPLSVATRQRSHRRCRQGFPPIALRFPGSQALKKKPAPPCAGIFGFIGWRYKRCSRPWARGVRGVGHLVPIAARLPCKGRPPLSRPCCYRPWTALSPLRWQRVLFSASPMTLAVGGRRQGL